MFKRNLLSSFPPLLGFCTTEAIEKARAKRPASCLKGAACFSFHDKGSPNPSDPSSKI